jgi:hypothetical protein
MPQKRRRPEPRWVGFQCTREEYEEIVEAAEADRSATSEWIRKILIDAARRGQGATARLH